jgi:hypothetical protein
MRRHYSSIDEKLPVKVLKKAAFARHRDSVRESTQPKGAFDNRQGRKKAKKNDWLTWPERVPD